MSTSSPSVTVNYGPGQPSHPQVEKEEEVWRGTTWPAMIMSPLCCSSIHWVITNKSIRTRSGCCGMKEDVLDLRRISDLKYRPSPCCCCCRGTVTIRSDDDNPYLSITHFHASDLYKKINTLRLTLGVAVAAV
jgi:hypothetical protein